MKKLNEKYWDLSFIQFNLCVCPLDDDDPLFSDPPICRFFSYSLDDRIVPRHRAVVEKRVNFKLRYMLASSDEEFAKRVEAAVERRTRFESGVMAMGDTDAFSGSQTNNDSLAQG